MNYPGFLEKKFFLVEPVGNRLSNIDYLSARNIGYLSQEMISYVSDVSYEIKELFYVESIITFWIG